MNMVLVFFKVYTSRFVETSSVSEAGLAGYIYSGAITQNSFCRCYIPGKAYNISLLYSQYKKSYIPSTFSRGAHSGYYYHFKRIL